MSSDRADHDEQDGEHDDDPSPLTWRELLAETTARLERAGLAGASSQARRIVAHATGHDDATLALHLGDHATVRGVAHLDAMVARRTSGEPLQYVLGSWGFRTLDLLVDRRVLIPRPETEQLVEVALGEYDRIAGQRGGSGPNVAVTVVDLGTGSGAIALSVATERVSAQVWASDASSDALAVARANLAGIGRRGARVRLVEGSWFDALPGELAGTVDLVVSNPPYVAEADPLPVEVEAWEPAMALRSGPDGLRDLRRIVGEAPRWLAPGGALAVELDERQAPAVSQLAAEVGLVDVRTERDLTGRDRVVVGRRPA